MSKFEQLVGNDINSNDKMLNYGDLTAVCKRIGGKCKIMMVVDDVKHHIRWDLRRDAHGKFLYMETEFLPALCMTSTEILISSIDPNQRVIIRCQGVTYNEFTCIAMAGEIHLITQ